MNLKQKTSICLKTVAFAKTSVISAIEKKQCDRDRTKFDYDIIKRISYMLWQNKNRISLFRKEK